MSTAKRLAAGAAWTYGSQVAVVFAQVGYAAVTSRAVAPEEFGYYAVALTMSGLFTLVATGGLSQTVSRLTNEEIESLPSLWSMAAILGFGCAAVAYLLANVFANLWATEEAAEVLRLLAVTAAVAPVVGLCSGLLRRAGKFKMVAGATLTSALLGMIIGSTAVIHYRTAESLAVSVVVAQTVLAVYLTFSVRGSISFARPWGRSNPTSFSVKVICSYLFQYLVSYLPRFSAAHVTPAAALGQWNRAEVLGYVPFQQMQAALVPVVYPEFRHDRSDSHRAYVVWTDILALVAWITFPVGLAAAATLPVLIPILFGDGWDQAAWLAIPLALAGTIQAVVNLLAAGMEALGRFKVIWVVNLLQLLAQLGLALSVLITRSVWPAVLGLVLCQVISHVVMVTAASRSNLLEPRRLVRNYLGATMSGALVALLALGVVGGLAGGEPLLALVAAVCGLVAAVLLFRQRRQLAPVRIAARRGLVASSVGNAA